MIISHKYKYIFIKPKKVAGTSIEINLAKHTGDDDIVTSINEFSIHSDGDKYEHQDKNTGEFVNHTLPNDIFKSVGKHVWDSYTKITVVRNPWDNIISWYWWLKYKEPYVFEDFRNQYSKIRWMFFVFRNKIYNFFSDNQSDVELQLLVENLKDEYINTPYYFSNVGDPVADYYIRYENLDEDYKSICHKLGIPYKILPKTKSKQRKEKKHYSTYFNDHIRDLVKEIYKRELDYFRYKFEATT